MKEKTKTRFFLFAIGLFVLGSCFSSVTVNAATLGDIKKFYVDSSYDISGRSEVSATLERISNQLYFYVDDSWWGKLFLEDKNKIDLSLFILADEFEKKIYPMLTSAFGSEWKPGIDNDAKITILIHPMKKNSGGYFNTGNEYSKLENPNSNEREMFYLNSDYITYSLAKSFLAHEFVHLITFNQKDIIQNIEEDVWLNEARADYAPTLLGYDNVYQGSNLQRRVNEFLRNPSNSIVDWQGAYADYGALNLFTQYLVDNYGIKILVDSLNSPKKGIESINYALAKNNHSEDFSQVFTNWTIAVSVNNCSFGQKYCYKNENLKNLKVTPADNLLPVDSQSNLISNTRTKDWAGHWQRIFGGGGTLTFSFEGSINSVFKVPYVLCDNTNIC